MKFLEMQLLLVKVIVLIAVTTKGVLNELNPEGRNVCLESVNYTKEIQIIIKVPEVKYVPCLIPFTLFPKTQPCRTAKTVWVEKKIPKVVSRSKIMPMCCSGYMLINSTETECVPDCRIKNSFGCENGKCVAPMVCDCLDGYTGRLCEKSCHEGFWGKNCHYKCDCLNEGKCDKTYGCVCQPGWKGIRCEYPCEEGYYGHECKEKCICNGDACSHITGECIISTTEATTTTKEETVTSSTEATIISTTEDTITSTTETVEDSIILTKEDTTISITEATTSTVLRTATNKSQITSFTDPVISTESTASVFHQSGKGSPGKEIVFKWLHFLPSLSVLSATSFLIIAIAAKWVINKHRRKTKMALSGKGRNVRAEDPLKFQAENVFMVNYHKVSAVHMTDVDLRNETPTLETFKPLNNSSKQK